MYSAKGAGKVKICPEFCPKHAIGVTKSEAVKPAAGLLIVAENVPLVPLSSVTRNSINM